MNVIPLYVDSLDPQYHHLRTLFCHQSIWLMMMLETLVDHDIRRKFEIQYETRNWVLEMYFSGNNEDTEPGMQFWDMAFKLHSKKNTEFLYDTEIFWAYHFGPVKPILEPKRANLSIVHYDKKSTLPKNCQVFSNLFKRVNPKFLELIHVRH